MSEKEQLIELAGKPFVQRIGGYLKLSGPGYMQSAMTLGGGSIASCVLMGSLLGYQLLWVQPLAIFLGVCVLAAVAKQTCHTGEKPYAVFWNRLHPAMAIAWGLAALVATVLWHIPQYSLTANGAVELARGIGVDLNGTLGRAFIGVTVLAAAGYVCFLYSAGARGLKLYEMLVKVLVWSIVGAFAIVTFSTGINFKELFLGFTGISFIQYVSANGMPQEAIIPIVGGIAAAVGINMVFLYPYSLLKKGWGKEHRELAYFDLVSGMAIPFVFATAFMMIAVANTIGPEPGSAGTIVQDIREILPVLDETLGATLSLLLIGLGMFAIGFSTIITHMLASGFIGCELFGFEYRGKAKLWFTLLPAIGIVGVMVKFPWWAAVTASSLAAPLMPIAVVGFIILLNSKAYMGDARPEGLKRVFWNVVLIAAVTILSVAAYNGLVRNWATLKGNLAATPAAVEEAPEEAPEEAESGASASRLFPPAHSGEPPVMIKQEVARNLMGTRFEITMYAPAGESNPTALAEVGLAALDRIEALERRVSNWRVDTFTSKVNRLAAEGPVEVHPDLLELLRASKAAWDDTGGVFDVTVGPLLDLWGVYRKQEHIPGDAEIQEALKRVGLDKVEIDYDKRTVRFTVPGLRLDFGGIGKGYALDVAAQTLKNAGIECALLSGGDSTYVALGAPPGTAGWPIVVDKIYEGAEDYVDRVDIRDASFSTSSGEGRQFEKDGKRFTHIYDPRTGQAVDATLGAMVIAPNGTVADALSTAFLIMSEDEIRAYCGKHPDVRAIKVGLVDGKPVPVRINFPEA
ncbi:MAG: FAD:protein FMN transferase [Candidatus Hydrogenedentes bacterium]|nr:FAD:protein FMN transferase [Candidatus Hydrogenedentota bacterium]